MNTAQTFATVAKGPTYPRLLICEGAKDKAFFEFFIETRDLPRFHVLDARGMGDKSGGITGFARALNAWQVTRDPGFRVVRHILLVADNDETPQENFANVCAQAEKVFGAGSAPTQPEQRTSGLPSVTVLMIPEPGVNGNLETLCVAPAREADRQTAAHVDTFSALVGADIWTSESRKGKMWLRSLLAVRCTHDPFVPLGKVFTEQRNRQLIPLGHASLDRIANLLAGF